MSQCFQTCGCSEYDGVTRADLDRITDKIENALNDENGRKIFRGFLNTANLNDAKKCLKFWEKCDQTIRSKIAESEDPKHNREFFDMVDKLLDEADGIEELNFAIVEKLTLVRDSEDKKEVLTILKLMRLELVKIMKGEFQLFKNHFITKRYV